MGFVIKKKRGLSVSYNLNNLRGYRKIYKESLEKDIIPKATYKVGQNAYNILRNRFFATRSSKEKDRHRKPLNQHLTYRLFGTKPGYSDMVVKKGPGKFELNIIRDLVEIKRDLPHLKWQEQGFKSFVRAQLYRRYYSVEDHRWKFYPIKERKAISAWMKDFRSMKMFYIKHPGVSARHFILYTRRYLKSDQAAKDFRFYVRQELRRYFSNA